MAIHGAEQGPPADRPTVDVVVPFFGSHDELVEVVGRMSQLRLGPQDTLTVVDNRPGSEPALLEDPRLIRARAPVAGLRSQRRGGARPRRMVDLPRRRRRAGPGSGRPVLRRRPPGRRRRGAGGRDPRPGASARAAPVVRRALRFLRRSMAQTTTKAQLGPFAKTANAAVRRSAFEAIGGLRGHLLSGEDVDLCYRLRDAGWRLEFRDGAIVEHRGRQTVRALIAQQTRHGAGAAWLDIEYPGFSPPFRWSSLVVSMVRGTLKGGWARLRGDRDRSLIEVFDPLTALAFHLGRFRSNDVEASG